MSSRPIPAIPFEPALEGLRGVAVLGVLLFHAELPWAMGGYLGVSTFFTLSGFLITSLLASERERLGRVHLLAFWARRFRRLMPAALLTLFAIAALEPRMASSEALGTLAGDVLWALGYLANWRLLDGDVAYTQIFLDPSPVQHFWSLAIEEQFYALYPLLFVGVAAFGRRRSTCVALLGFAAISTGIAIWIFASGGSLDRIYYGTDTRAAEFLIGAGLACTGPRSWRSTHPGLANAVVWVGGLALTGALWLWATTPVSSEWLYRGGFALYGLLSAVVIAAAVSGRGPVRSLLSQPTLRWIGKISYGAYLYHWPVYLWLSDERLGFGGAAAFALRLGLTLAVAGASYRFVEEPIRRGRALVGGRALAAAGAAAAAVVAAVWTIPVAHPEASFATQEPIASIAPTRDGLPRIALYGDSTALRLNTGLLKWTQESGQARPGRGVHVPGCGIDRGGWRRHRGRVARVPLVCRSREEQWAESLEDIPPDIAVVLTGTWEVADRRLPGEDTWRHLGDPVYDEFLRGELLRAVDLLSSRGALVVWLTYAGSERSRQSRPELELERTQRLNALIAELPASRPDRVRVIDFRALVEALPDRVAGAPARPDGVHLTHAAAYHVVGEELGRRLLELHRSVPPRSVRPKTPSDR